MGEKNLMNFGPRGLFRDTKFLPFMGAGPTNFLQALKIDLGLLAHTPNGDRGPPENFKGEH